MHVSFQNIKIHHQDENLTAQFLCGSLNSQGNQKGMCLNTFQERDLFLN